jgi:hypothetical protein
MNASDVLKYGHGTVVQTIDRLTDEEWTASGACGVWSPKDIIAHLASFELVLIDVLHSLLGDGPTPYLDKFTQQHAEFNDAEVDRRKAQSVADTLAEYNDAHAEVMDLIKQIPAETLRRPGALSWYGAEYDVEDFLVYTYYGHKREHMGQVAVFRDRFAR